MYMLSLVSFSSVIAQHWYVYHGISMNSVTKWNACNWLLSVPQHHKKTNNNMNQKCNENTHSKIPLEDGAWSRFTRGRFWNISVQVQARDNEFHLSDERRMNDRIQFPFSRENLPRKFSGEKALSYSGYVPAKVLFTPSESDITSKDTNISPFRPEESNFAWKIGCIRIAHFQANSLSLAMDKA